MKPTSQRWAHFRFSVIGTLLASPPEAHGELAQAVQRLAEKTWVHPTSGKSVQYQASTIERWYYLVAHQVVGGDTISSLARKRRSDAGRTIITPELAAALLAQYQKHRSWSAKLHYDNIVELIKGSSALGVAPSYQTVRRFYRRKGLMRLPRRRGDERPGAEAARLRQTAKETRSYEVEHVGGLWHLDFHKARRQILLGDGTWVTPVALAMIDDHSRLAAHVQWYLTEQTRDLVHGFTQALMRRGLPRALMTDNGSAMTSDEFRSGLGRLGITHETTLPYSPHQNAKVENFWARLEGRAMAMFEGVKSPSLTLLNDATFAWVEMEYNREVHGETNEAPTARFLGGKSVLRPSPPAQQLRDAFRIDERRTQRRGDGTVVIGGVRFELPGHLRHLLTLTVRYARWDLTHVHVICDQTGLVLAPLYPLDKTKNADGRRRALPAVPVMLPRQEGSDDHMAPLLKRLMADFAATGRPPAYLPQTYEP